MNIPMKQNRLTDLENRPVVAKAGNGAGMDWEFGIGRCKLEIGRASCRERV